MIIFPAIEIKDGRCVRLTCGEFDTAAEVADDPVEAAGAFRSLGAEHLHIVDLDGAREGYRKNRDLILKIANRFDGFVQVGGGIRDEGDIRDYLDHGISRVILGSKAFRDREFLKYAAFLHGERMAVGIDARGGMVSLAGWTETTRTNYLEFAAECEIYGIDNIIFTDIGRDGTLEGVNLDALRDLNAAVTCNITASGGVRDIHDIHAIKELDLYGVICGKSLYSGTLDLTEALGLSKELV